MAGEQPGRVGIDQRIFPLRHGRGPAGLFGRQPQPPGVTFGLLLEAHFPGHAHDLALQPRLRRLVAAVQHLVEHAPHDARIARDRVLLVGHSAGGCNPDGGILAAGATEPTAVLAVDSCLGEKSDNALEALARDGELMAYRHESFWQCMDTVRDLKLLEGLWQSGKIPWTLRAKAEGNGQ